MNKTTDDLIYFKLEKDEFLELKKVFLSIEKSLLETLKEVKNFKEKRKKEFLLKDNLRKSFKSIKLFIGKNQSLFPKVKTNLNNIDKDSLNEKKFKKDNYDLDKQLQEIKNQLSLIGTNK